MRFPYHDGSDGDFERLACAICSELLGAGVQPFSTGPDGGRDGRFEGTAAKFPSPNDPQSGRFIIQAKHTEDPCAKFGDPDFSGLGNSAVITNEIPRIRRLVENGELDNYLLFSNRRLAANADADLRARIKAECGVKHVELFGIERIDLLLRQHPVIANVADLKLLSAPLMVTPDDLAVVITSLDAQSSTFAQAMGSVDELARVRFSQKNTANGLSPEFAKEIVAKYLKDFQSVKEFLAHPQNHGIVLHYDEADQEFHEQILAHRADHDTFDKVLLRLQTILWSRDPDLNRRKRLTKLVIYYMYWNCDIGQAAA